MQQTLDHVSWPRRSRLAGALTYHWLRLRRIAGWLLLILLLSQLIGVGMALFGWMDCHTAGVSAELGLTLALTLYLACMVAKSSTTFLLRFGTSRFAVWLSNLIALIACGVVFLLGTLAVSMLFNGLVVLLDANPHFLLVAPNGPGALTGGPGYAHSLARALAEFPQGMLWAAEWACLFYLAGCCLRKNKAITLAVLIAGPLLLWLLMLLPVAREVIETVESGNQADIMLNGLQWMKWLGDIARFVAREWQWIQAGLALASLPLSYLCMRSTAQPDK